MGINEMTEYNIAEGLKATIRLIDRQGNPVDIEEFGRTVSDILQSLLQPGASFEQVPPEFLFFINLSEKVFQGTYDQLLQIGVSLFAGALFAAYLNAESLSIESQISPIEIADLPGIKAQFLNKYQKEHSSEVSAEYMEALSKQLEAIEAFLGGRNEDPSTCQESDGSGSSDDNGEKHTKDLP